MAARTPVVYVEGPVLIWARERMNLDVAEVAAKLQVREELVLGWERGDEPVSVARLRRLADLYGQTLPFFLRSAPPIENTATRPPDFRGRAATKPSMSLMRELDRANRRRQNFIDLEGSEPFALREMWNGNPEQTAISVRELIDVTRGPGTRDVAKAFRFWIELLEEHGILVFQMSGVEVSECQGLSLYFPHVPIIVLNGADEVPVRIFTLLHELGHLVHRSGAMCELNSDNTIERECNSFAAAFLMPEREFKNLVQAEEPLSQIGLLAKHFAVSWSAVVVRMKTFSLITQHQLDAQLELAARTARERRADQIRRLRERDSFIPHYKLKLRNLGARYVSSVLDAMYEERISAVDASYFLESKLGTMRKMESELMHGEISA